MRNSITVTANDGEAWEFTGDNKMILDFIENYNGSDLASDLIIKPFVKDAQPTGIYLTTKKLDQAKKLWE